MPHQRREIIIPISQIMRKMPEIGQIDQETTSTTASAQLKQSSAPSEPKQPAFAMGGGLSGGIRIAGSKMAFALITKTKQGKKINV